MRRWRSVIRLFARVIQQLGFWTQNIQAHVDYCYVWWREETCRVHFARPWTLASKLMLTDPSLAAKRRVAELHVAFCSHCCCNGSVGIN